MLAFIAGKLCALGKTNDNPTQEDKTMTLNDQIRNAKDKILELQIAIENSDDVEMELLSEYLEARFAKEPTIVKVGGDQVAKAQVEVQKQLTDLDLVKEICAPAFIVDQKQTDLLCREMFCRMQQRGLDAQTSQSDCSEIANIANTKSIQLACKDLKKEELESCVDLFFKRK